MVDFKFQLGWWVIASVIINLIHKLRIYYFKDKSIKSKKKSLSFKSIPAENIRTIFIIKNILYFN